MAVVPSKQVGAARHFLLVPFQVKRVTVAAGRCRIVTAVAGLVRTADGLCVARVAEAPTGQAKNRFPASKAGIGRVHVSA